MKYRVKQALATLSALGLTLAAAGTASAASVTPSAYTPGDCGNGRQVVNVTYSLTNDADSGFFGNWATDSLKRNLKVVDLGNGTYCATVNDTGSFVTTGPLSPENGVPLAAGISGVVNGGYVTSDFTGTLNSDPAYATHGNLGTFDANGAHPSFVSYFSTMGSWDQPTWGWTYHTAQNGDWVNASSGSTGDISGN